MKTLKMYFIVHFSCFCVAAVQFLRIKKVAVENAAIISTPVTVAPFERLNIKLKLCIYVN